MKCCNKTLILQTSEKGVKYYYCETCKRGGKGKTAKEAESDFNKSVTSTTNQSSQISVIPKDHRQIMSWQSDNMPALTNRSAQFIDKPATKRMIEKNTQYMINLASNKSFDEIWSTPEGQQSITNAYTEALYMGATLGDMGDIVPFGSTAEFIGNIESYQFALTTGKNAPFEEIDIIPVYTNDQKKVSQKNGNFCIDLDYGFPRGELMAIVVKAKLTDTGKYIGDVYAVERLLKKAKNHSPSYKSYLKDKQDFERLRSEGKLSKDKTGREGIEKTGKYGKYYIYEDDLTNPYDGPDRPEMLKKAAGKSFFRPYMKVRNASAMADEWENDEPENRDQAADFVLNQAGEQFADIVDGEIIEDVDSVENDDQPQKENNNGVANEDLFDQDSNDL